MIKKSLNSCSAEGADFPKKSKEKWESKESTEEKSRIKVNKAKENCEDYAGSINIKYCILCSTDPVLFQCKIIHKYTVHYTRCIRLKLNSNHYQTFSYPTSIKFRV